MALSDAQLDMAIERLGRLQAHRLRQAQNAQFIDSEMAFPGLSMADVKEALHELRQVRRQNAWVRQQLDPSWSSPAKT